MWVSSFGRNFRLIVGTFINYVHCQMSLKLMLSVNPLAPNMERNILHPAIHVVIHAAGLIFKLFEVFEWKLFDRLKGFSALWNY